MEFDKTRLLESIIKKDPDLGATAWANVNQKAKSNAFFQRVQKELLEGLLGPDANALGYVYGLVSDMAQPNTLGRELIDVVQTTKPSVRYPRAKGKAQAQKISNTTPLMLGETYDYVDIISNTEIATGQKWSQTFVEDAEWNVLQRQVQAIGKGIAYTETADIIALYNAIANANLASGAEITVTAPIAWADFLNLLAAVDTEDFTPRVIAVTPTVWYELFKLTEFIDSVYVTSEKGLKPNVAHVIAPNDLFIVKSSQVTKTLVIDTQAAAVMALRRDVMVQPWEDPARMEHGVTGSERYGLGVLRTKAVARGTR